MASMTLRSEFEAIVRCVLANGHPGLESFRVSSSGDDIACEIKHGWRTPAHALERVHGRELLVELIYRTLKSRWSRYDRYAMSIRPPTDDDLPRLQQLHPACVNRCEHGPGWYDLLHATLLLIEETGASAWQTTQIKEKFGGLRLYYFGDVGELGSEIIDAAENVSEHICEECRAPGKTRPGGWIRTLCDECAKSMRK